MHFLKLQINEFHPCRQMLSEATDRDLRDRREIRGNVTQALASLPMSSVLDVGQISSALAQSTVSEHFDDKIATKSILSV